MSDKTDTRPPTSVDRPDPEPEIPTPSLVVFGADDDDVVCVDDTCLPAEARA